MRKGNYIFFALVLILLGAYFFGFKEKDSLDLSYQEPDSVFFSPSLIQEGDIVVEISDVEFAPAVLNIKKGEKVVWVNKIDGYSWPASDPHPTHTNYPESSPGFDPEVPMRANEAWSFTFNKVGSWKYHDHLDPSKRGIVNVSE